MKSLRFTRFFEGNKFVLMCVFFTAILTIETVSNSISGSETILNIGILIWGFLSLGAVVLPISLVQYLYKSDIISEENILLRAIFPFHYVASSVLQMFLIFLRSFFEPLPQGIYLVALTQYTVSYVIIVIGAVIVNLIQTARDNKNLRKIQANRRRIKP